MNKIDEIMSDIPEFYVMTTDKNVKKETFSHVLHRNDMQLSIHQLCDAVQYLGTFGGTTFGNFYSQANKL